MSVPAETIAAVATAQGRGGVGIVRISGPLASKAALAFCERELDRKSTRLNSSHRL